MKPLRTLFFLEGSNSLRVGSTILFEDKLWLVPYWRDNHEERYSTPERLILLETIPHQKSDGKDYDYLINDPIPKAVFEGKPHVPKDILYVVREDPAVRFPLGFGDLKG